MSHCGYNSPLNFSKYCHKNRVTMDYNIHFGKSNIPRTARANGTRFAIQTYLTNASFGSKF